MENVLQAAKKLNYSLPQQPQLKRSLSTNPTTHTTTVVQLRGQTEARVMDWLKARGVRRGDPLSIYEHYQERRKKIVANRQNESPVLKLEKKSSVLLARRLQSKMSVNL